MILIIGGAGQGKLDYVLSKTGFGEADVARDPEAAKKKVTGLIPMPIWLRFCCAFSYCCTLHHR